MPKESSGYEHEPKKISRRQFLFRGTLTALLGSVAAATAYIEKKTGIPSLIVKEKVPIWVESAMDYANDTVELRRQVFLDESNYTAEHISVGINTDKLVTALHTKPAKITFIDFKPSAHIRLQPTLYGRRDLSLVDSPGVSGPVAPVSGDYVYSASRQNEERNMNMQMPARDMNGNDYGPQVLEDRLPFNVSAEVNTSASGGLVFRNNTFEITDQAGLFAAKDSGESFMQSWFTIDPSNEAEVLKQSWTHQRVQSEIGNSVYTWSAYVEYTGTNGESKKGLIVLNGGEDRLSVWHLVKVCKELSVDGKYKLALMDAGNGNPVFIQPESSPDYYYSFGEKPAEAHLSPITFFAT